MTLDSKLSKAVYEGNGSTTVFPFAFKVWETSHIAVTMTDAAGVSTNVTSNCTVTLTSSGGSVTYPNSGSPLPSGSKLAITRNMPFTQGINLTTASRFDPQVLEDGLDQATAERQQILEQMARAVILPATSSESPQDVVAAIYASRDAAAASASDASAQATAAAGSATSAANSAATAEQTVQTATAQALADATAQANTAANSAAAAAQSALDAAAAVPENLVGRVTDVEGVASAAKAVTDKATATPTSGGLPIADNNNHLALGWFGSMLCNVRTVLTVSTTFVAPVSGWYRVTCVGGGGSGGGAPIHGGLCGGTTSFGAYLSAIGGAGGVGNGRPGYYDAHGGSGAGAAGEVTVALIYLLKGTSVTVTIGAGGVCSTTYNTLPTGVGAPVPTYNFYSSTRGQIGGKGAGNGTATSYDGTNGSHANGVGGNGGRNGTGYGGGGGGSGAANGTGGLGADGGANGAIGTASSTVSIQGGTGGNGAVILEYFDPAIAA